jgi:hypothetical protein
MAAVALVLRVLIILLAAFFPPLSPGVSQKLCHCSSGTFNVLQIYFCQLPPKSSSPLLKNCRMWKCSLPPAEPRFLHQSLQSSFHFFCACSCFSSSLKALASALASRVLSIDCDGLAPGIVVGNHVFANGCVEFYGNTMIITPCMFFCCFLFSKNNPAIFILAIQRNTYSHPGDTKVCLPCTIFLVIHNFQSIN